MAMSASPGTHTTHALARRINGPFLGSLAVVIGCYLVMLVVLRSLIPDNEVAATLSALVIGAGPRVQRELELRLPRAPVPLVTFDGYRIRWWALIAGGALAIWLAESIRIVLELRVGPATAVSASADSALTLLPIAVAVAIGMLAGARSDRWPFLVVAAAIVLGHLAAVVSSRSVQDWAVGAAPPSAICQPADTQSGGPQPPEGSPPGTVAGPECPPDPVDALFGTGPVAVLLSDELPILILTGMAALWWGSRMRYAFYLGHVAGSLGDADRAALLAMAMDEQRRGSHRDPG